MRENHITLIIVLTIQQVPDFLNEKYQENEQKKKYMPETLKCTRGTKGEVSYNDALDSFSLLFLLRIEIIFLAPNAMTP